MSKKRAPAPAATVPKFTDPGPGLLLADVPGLPEAVADALAAKGVRTLADLRPRCEARATADATCEPAFAVLEALAPELSPFKRYKAGEALVNLLGGRVHLLKVMGGWDAKPAPGADDFNEATPPPRTRPKGEPVARSVELPPGEPVVELFRRWDADGRIEPGCVLAEYTRAGGCSPGRRASPPPRAEERP